MSDSAQFRKGIDRARTVLALGTFFAALACLAIVYQQSRIQTNKGKEYPLAASWGNVLSAYVPILVTIFGFLWARKRSPPPTFTRGEERMNQLAELMTYLAFAVIWGIPIFFYAQMSAADANQFMVAFNGAVHTVIAGGLTYYFGKAPSPIDAAKGTTSESVTQ